MISFIIPFASKGDNLYQRRDMDEGMIILSTILSIKNINKTFDVPKEIILVDNTHSFPNIKMDNLKIVKGWQALTEDEVRKQPTFEKYNIDDFNVLAMWCSMAHNVGIEHAKGDYIILQHNDMFYHENLLPKLYQTLEHNEYVAVDSKHLTLTGYLGNKDIIDSLDIDFEIGYESGGFIKQKMFGLSDAYFFMCKREFFDDYYVDWGYGDCNHGATIKCLIEGKSFHHIGPFFGNSNYNTDESNTYIFFGKKFITHLKGGFSEYNLSFKKDNKKYNMSKGNNYLTKLKELS